MAEPELPPALGPTLRDACDRLLSALPTPPAELVRWRRDLEGWEQSERTTRAAEVARGLRLLRSGFGTAPATPPRGRGDTGDGPLERATDSLPGIGPALAARLAEHSIDTVEDLVWLVPRRYDDVRLVEPLVELAVRRPVGERVTVRATIQSCRFMRRGRRRWVDARLIDGPATLVVRWFGAHESMAKRFPAQAACVLSAKLTERGGQLELANPDVLEVVSEDGASRAEGVAIIPRYRELQGVPAATVRKSIRAAVERGLGEVRGAVPRTIAERLQLPPLEEALASLHKPPETLTVEEVVALNTGDSQWHRRLAFEELFVLGLVVARRRQRHRLDEGVPCPPRPDLDALIRKSLPFELTAAQERVIGEIRADLAQAVPMNRLLQGDVGSGKTAVAFAAMAQVARSGRQAALMAPTEILAEQHMGSLAPWCERLGLRVVLLTASTPRAIRSTTLALLAAGKIDVLVGTHALLSEEVAFADLGLVLIDEQHRFGVAQRVQLRAKGEAGAPHLLVMTATPIPRTLALTAYGDLDVSVIDELPPGRRPPRTEVLAGKPGRARAYRLLRARLAEGDRGYLVCPMVEPGEDTTADWANTETAAAAIAEKWPEISIAVVHGRLSSEERNLAMDRFRKGDAQLLIATTVIEVGVDVPEATVMLVEDADRFGLSQLHQLRGRVGRGGGEALCLLATRGGPTADGARRLEVMGKTGDGFLIAEADLEIRGPGELLGTRQAGLPKLRFGDLVKHTGLLKAARAEAEALLARDPELREADHSMLAEVLRRHEGQEVYGAEGG